MSTSVRISNLFAVEDWRKLYTTFTNADFQSYDYETLRKTMVDYLRTYYPEDFNDYIESSEFIALLDLISFMGQSLSFRGDLNFRENFIQTAERRDSIYRMASMLGYSPSRCRAAHGMLKVVALNTTENIVDSNGTNLQERTVNWNDPANSDWQEQFIAILNAALQSEQRIGKPSGSLFIGNIRTDHYEIHTQPNQIPSLTFSSTIGGTGMEFNIYDVGISEEKGIYERSPIPGESLGMLYRTDGEGNASPNTGFFFGFKQGRLTNMDFTINERLANRVVGINVNNINNSDVWLYEITDAGGYVKEWKNVDVLRDSNVVYNDISAQERDLFTVYSRADDQIDLVFGDGVFSEIPIGNFRSTVRVSNGLSYSIVPQEMRNITVNIFYVSEIGKIERLTITLALQYTVNNASTKENLSDIKIKAPQSYYTQNRMINGEDYNTLPYVRYSDIIKIKAVNRTASGISRYLDLKDVTGKYSSTNIYCNDGFIYDEENVLNGKFSWTTTAEIQNFISNTLARVNAQRETSNIFYRHFPTRVPPETYWVRGTALSGTCTGFFALQSSRPSDGVYDVQQLGESATNNRKFIEPGALLLFRAPSGSYVDIDRTVVAGTPTQNGQVTEIWASVNAVENDGTANGNGYLLGNSGAGPVELTENIPSGMQLVEIYPAYNSRFSIETEQEIVRRIVNNESFALRYDDETRSWKSVAILNVDTASAFSLAQAGDTSNASLDASWLLLLVNEGANRYTWYNRTLTYYFGSEIETRFYFDPETRVYNSRNNTVIKDQIRFLKGNTLPDSSEFLPDEMKMEIYNTVNFADGYKDDSRVKVSYADSDNDGVPDNPRVFEHMVAPTVNVLNKLIVLERYLDFSNFERFRYFDSAAVSTNYPTLETIEINGKFAHPIGTVFYAYNEQAFYKLELIENARTVTPTTDYIARTGRSNLNFQYRHNSPNDRRIDPSASNVIDMYVLTESYDKSFRNWIRDRSGKLEKPQKPTLTELALNYQQLDRLKSISDTITYTPASYKLLFGNKADADLQAIFKVVKSNDTRLSNSEIRTRVVEAINSYFSIENWDFGNTFYFSELSAYLHQSLRSDISSVVLVPSSNQQFFGDLYEITCEPNEIFISAATVDNVEIIDSITASQLKTGLQTNVFGGYTPNPLRNL